MLRKGRTISFEFFPPRNAEGIPGVLDTVKELTAYSPDFVSVTYGAGGSTRQFTEEITISAKESASVEVMAHLTCAGQTVDELDDVLGRLEEAGIENVIALRGDPPRGEQQFTVTEGGFSHASDLVSHIKSNYEFGIAAACYPEGHTEAQSLERDLEYAKLKVDNGADFLITQLFFDNDDYFAFADRAAAAGISRTGGAGDSAGAERTADSPLHVPLRVQDTAGPGLGAGPPGRGRRCGPRAWH